MTERPEYKLGDQITLAQAAQIYADRDWREHDDKRGAEARARAQIKEAIKKGHLQYTDAARKALLIERFVSWAMVSNKFGRGAHKPDDEPPAWSGRYASDEWRARVTHPEWGYDPGADWRTRFQGIYEAPSGTVRRSHFEPRYQYSDEQRLLAFLQMEVPIPPVAAPQEWVNALAVALCQVDLLREQNLVLEDRRGKLSKAGKAPRDKPAKTQKRDIKKART